MFKVKACEFVGAFFIILYFRNFVELIDLYILLESFLSLKNAIYGNI